jgi:hypothetical protein
MGLDLELKLVLVLRVTNAAGGCGYGGVGVYDVRAWWRIWGVGVLAVYSRCSCASEVQPYDLHGGGLRQNMSALGQHLRRMGRVLGLTNQLVPRATDSGVGTDCELRGRGHRAQRGI